MKFKIGDIVEPLPSTFGVYSITNRKYVTKMVVLNVYENGTFDAEIKEITLAAMVLNIPDFDMGGMYFNLDSDLFKIVNKVKLLSLRRDK